MVQQQSSVEDVLDNIRPFLPELITACEFVAGSLYQPMEQATWDKFADVLEGMDDLYRTLNSIHSEMDPSAVLWSYLKVFIAEFSSNFQIMNNYMDAEQYREAGDCIHYELNPLFYQLEIAIGGARTIAEQRYGANLEYIKVKFPKLYDQIISIDKNNHVYQTMNARNGAPNLCVTLAEKAPVYLYSTYNPLDEADRWVQHLTDKVQGKDNIIIYGVGFGYHISAYLDAYPDHNVYLYEPDEQIFLAAMKSVDLNKLLDRPQIKDFVVGGNASQQAKLFYKFLRYMKGEPEILSLPIYQSLMADKVSQFCNDAIIAIMNYDSSYRLYEKFGREWLENTLFNLSTTLSTPPITNMKNKLEGFSAVIVGAGPSLEADIKHLSNLKEHAYIIAAGSTIQSLLHFGITPHLIISMDGTDANYNVFRDLDISHIPLLYTPMVKYKIIDKKWDYLFHMHFHNDVASKKIMELSDQDPLFNSNHSVTGTAIQAAIYMGCKEIIFTGQDLSYPNDRVYSPGAKHFKEEKLEQQIEAATLVVENVNGTMNRTSNLMKLTLADIESVLEGYPAVQFINTTAMGAKIKYTTAEPMEQVVKRLGNKKTDENFFIKEIKESSHYENERLQTIKNLVFRMPEELKSYEEGLKGINKNIEKLPELSRKNPQKCFTLIKTIETDWKVAINSQPFQVFCFMLFRNALSEFERDLPELAEENNMIKKAKLAQEIMKPLVVKLLDEIPRMKELIDETVKRVGAGTNI
ncbi:Uncharacterized conserved protein [Paenibacillus algorifonticola]|uniref:Uncharacterized conserved protein n=1 Tax=Paenibacillus algorifonticola TaxID=684063 RepID=A0A1I2IX47_9BACL|nr:6-hydroxymethylpterin diphosphokinase MptE-like protein [Paenibacillus algorifonticola]SFF38537.1 Uncharacterized conserved protein [Paenibacillus algorifonticola]SFF46183.1 Uncharacterized conserved protein [Paenibacillus algorifonticola]